MGEQTSTLIISDFRARCEELYVEARDRIINETPLGYINKQVNTEDLYVFFNITQGFNNNMDLLVNVILKKNPEMYESISAITKEYMNRLDPLSKDLRNRLGK